jgi:hypothetical protein
MFSKSRDKSETTQSAPAKKGPFRRRRASNLKAPSDDDHRSSHYSARSNDEAFRDGAEYEDGEAVGDEGHLFHSDKRQKKLVYRRFNTDPAKVLKVVAEDIPEPLNDRHVVIKVTVRIKFAFLLVSMFFLSQFLTL